MIDIKSINYILFSLGEQRLKRSKIAFINRGFLYGIFSFIWQFIVSFKNYGLWFPKFKGKGRVLFYGLTINNRLVLRKLIDNFKYESISIIDNKSHPRWLEYLFSLPYFLI